MTRDLNPLNRAEAISGSVDWDRGRRAFLRSFGFGSMAAVALAGGAPRAGAQTAASAADVFNFALNFEYLGFRFYDIALNGYPIITPGLTSPSGVIRYLTFDGVGASGTPRGGHSVPFTDPLVRSIAREFRDDEAAHVNFLRSILGSAAIAQPVIDLDQSFTTFARFAGLVPMNGVFDAFANDANFLIGAFILEDVCVTALKGATPLLRNNEFLEGAAGLLAIESYQAGVLRTMLAMRGQFTQAQQVSNLRDYFDGPSDIDQGIGTATSPNIVPTDANSLAFSRTPEQVRNIAYATTDGQPGGFFPAGLNGAIR